MLGSCICLHASKAQGKILSGHLTMIKQSAGDEWVDWVGMSVYSLGPYNPRYGQNVVGYYNELTMKARREFLYKHFSH